MLPFICEMISFLFLLDQVFTYKLLDSPMYDHLQARASASQYEIKVTLFRVRSRNGDNQLARDTRV